MFRQQRLWVVGFDGPRIAKHIEDFLYGLGIDAVVTNMDTARSRDTDLTANVRVENITADADLTMPVERILSRHIKVLCGAEVLVRLSNVQTALANRQSRHKRVRD